MVPAAAPTAAPVPASPAMAPIAAPPTAPRAAPWTRSLPVPVCGGCAAGLLATEFCAQARHSPSSLDCCEALWPLDGYAAGFCAAALKVRDRKAAPSAVRIIGFMLRTPGDIPCH